MRADRRQLARYLVIVSVFSNLPSGIGVILPPFRQLAHDLQSGPIEIINATSIHITEFFYDGQGPDAYFWVGRGLPSEDGTRIPDEYGSVAPLSMYEGKNITLHLPSNLTTFDVDYLAVWCVKYKHNFGHVFMNERYIKRNDSALFLPLNLKPFNGPCVKSDSVVIEIIKDEVEVTISNIRYNQSGDNVHFRLGSGDPSANREIILLESGQNLPNYTGETISLVLPRNANLSRIDYLAVWDGDQNKSLGVVYFEKTAIEEQSIDIRGVQLDKFRNDSYKLHSGPVILINDRTFYLSNFHHHYEHTEFRVSFKNSTTIQVPDETGVYTALKSYDGESFYVTLPNNIVVTQIDKFGIWHPSKGFLSYIVLNSTINIPKYRPHPDVTDDGKRIIRVQKCCPLNQIVSETGCQNAEVNFNVEMKIHIANDTHLNDDPMIRQRIVFAPYINNINCPKYHLRPDMDNYSLLTTGKLLYISAKEQVSLDKYCMDTVLADPKIGKYLNTALVCAEGESGPQPMHIVFAICAILSAVSLFLVTGIYFLIRKEDDKRGFSIAGYAASMGTAFTCLAITQLAGLEKVCSVLGGIFHFFIVMSFIWFVVIAFEAFYHVKYFEDHNLLPGFLKRRNIYIGLSCAIPILFVALAYLLDLPAGLLNMHLDEICLFKKQKWMLYVPIIICIALAVGLASYSAYQLRINRSIPKSDDRRYFIWRQINRDIQGRVRFSLFLVALTTVCWLSEIITFSLRFPIFVLDVIHALQGVMVLTTVVSTGGVFKKIMKSLNGSETPTSNGINGRNEVEMKRLNSDTN
ncbi:hypothetical protein Trydic_g8864 [Trypoxylus dichotomus]